MLKYDISEKSTIYWLGHASFKIKTSEKTIYIDPYEINETEPADIILITHPHYDHLSISDLQKLSTDKTIIVGTIDCTSKLAGNITSKFEIISSGGKKMIGGVEIEAVPAYNINKQFHQKESGWVGYIVTIDGKKIYHAGDTDRIPEMKGLNVDIALLPIGGTYTMDYKEALDACNDLNPKIIIPMHYNKIVGTNASALEFKKLVKDREVITI